jgi:hypothetical protein
MERIIRISNKDYRMKASAMTQFNYKNETGRSFLKDLQKLSAVNFDGLSEDESIDKLEDITELVLKVAYTMIKQADKNQVVNYEDFLDNIEDLYGNSDWINEVIELACSPLSGQLQKN